MREPWFRLRGVSLGWDELSQFLELLVKSQSHSQEKRLNLK